MGSKVPPDPGDFLLGDSCVICESGPHSIFLPERTPLVVKVEIFQDYEVIDTQFLTQSLVSPCSWSTGGYPGLYYAWWNYDVRWTQFFRSWMENAVTHNSFQYFAFPPCLTKMPNQIDPGDPDYLGDTAKITWGEGIEH